MNIQESKHLNAQSELLKALATSAISFASDEEANAAGFYWSDGVEFSANSTVATFGFEPNAHQIMGVAKRGVIFQYLDAFTKQPVGHSRVRYECPSVDFETGKPVKYKGPFGARVHSFFPSCIDWAKTAPDISVPIILTEGEKKAFSASQNIGIPTIGLGGVSSYKDSKRSPEPLLDDLMGIDWRDRTVYICFDSDVATNENVQAAQHRLALALLKLKAKPYIVTLPNAADGGKQGLDDFIMAVGAAIVLPFITTNARPLPEALALHAFTKRCVYVGRLKKFADALTGQQLSLQEAEHAVFAAHTLEVTKVVGGKLKHSVVNLFKAYSKWPGRKSVDRIEVHPGKQRLFMDHKGRDVLNQWNDARPSLNDMPIDEYLKFVRYMFADTPEYVEPFHDWVGQIVKNDVKNLTAWVFYSSQAGSGKSLLANIVGSMFTNQESDPDGGFLAISEAVMREDVVNGRKAAGVQVVLVDELTSHQRRDDAEQLKALMTNESCHVNDKFEKPIQIKDFRNYIFTTNVPNAVKVEPTDRRYWIVNAPEKPLDDDWYKDSLMWFTTPEGAGALRNYYLNVYQLSALAGVARRPFDTASRRDAIFESKNEVQKFVSELVAGELTYEGVTVWTAHTLAQLGVAVGLFRQDQMVANSSWIGRALRAENAKPETDVIMQKGSGASRRKFIPFVFEPEVKAQMLSASALWDLYEAEAVARAQLFDGVTKC